MRKLIILILVLSFFTYCKKEPENYPAAERSLITSTMGDRIEYVDSSGKIIVIVCDKAQDEIYKRNPTIGCVPYPYYNSFICSYYRDDSLRHINTFSTISLAKTNDGQSSIWGIFISNSGANSVSTMRHHDMITLVGEQFSNVYEAVATYPNDSSENIIYLNNSGIIGFSTNSKSLIFRKK